MKEQIKHTSFTQDWHHLPPSIFITSSLTHSVTLLHSASPSPFDAFPKLSLAAYRISIATFLPVFHSHFRFCGLQSLNESCDQFTIFAEQFTGSFHFWHQTIHTHTATANTHTLLIRARGPYFLMNLRVIKEPLDSCVYVCACVCKLLLIKPQRADLTN